MGRTRTSYPTGTPGHGDHHRPDTHRAPVGGG